MKSSSKPLQERRPSNKKIQVSRRSLDHRVDKGLIQLRYDRLRNENRIFRFGFEPVKLHGQKERDGKSKSTRGAFSWILTAESSLMTQIFKSS